MKDLSEDHTTSAMLASRFGNAAHVVVQEAGWRAPISAKTILHPVSFELEPGRVLGVVGPNGAGKSTLLRLLYRYQRPSTGCGKIDRVDIWSRSARVVAQSVAAVLQEQPTDFALTGFGGTEDTRDADIVEGALARLGLEGFANRHLGTLSGGERQRVMVARALAQEPRLLILDEPTNHLDIRHQLEVLALIRDLPLTIVTSLHDLNMAAAVCDDVLLLQDGRLLGFGHPETVFTATTVSNAFSVTARQERLSPSDAKHQPYHLRLGKTPREPSP